MPGCKVTAVLGQVLGLSVRSRKVGSQRGAAFKSLARRELDGMTKNLRLSRMNGVNRMADGVNRMVAEAEAHGTASVIEPIG